jgi:hypothetical protein
MLGFTNDDFKKLLMQSIIKGILWAILFLYIRKGLNSSNFTENPEKKWNAYKSDALYGGLSAFLMTIAKTIIWKQL